MLRQFFTRRPFAAQVASTAGLFAVGDVVGQQVFEPSFSKEAKSVSHDYWRTLRMAGFGGVVAAPMMWNWYSFLERAVRLSTPLKSTITRVILDQSLFAPTFIATFFTATSLMNGQGMDDIKHKFSVGYGDALSTNYKIWPWVQMANFYLVPLEYRMVVVNTVAIAWNGYLSWKQQESSK